MKQKQINEVGKIIDQLQELYPLVEQFKQAKSEQLLAWKLTQIDVQGLREVLDFIETSRPQIEDICGDLENTYESRSENWQESDRGEMMSDEIQHLQEACDDLDSAISNLQEALGQ